MLPLWNHQKKALEWLEKRFTGALFMEMGTGKSRIIIELLKKKNFKSALIVTTEKGQRVWKEQYEEFGGEITPVILKKPEMYVGSGISIINYEKMWKDGFMKAFLKSPPECVVMDESHKIKAAGSKVSQKAYLLSKRVKYRYILTGTPLGNTPFDIYGQFRFMDSSLLGTNFSNFSNKYANIDYSKGYPRIINYKDLDDLKAIIDENSFSVKAADVIDLPDEHSIVLKYELSPAAKKAYKGMKGDNIFKWGEELVSASNVVSKMLRLQQISSGFCPVYDDNMNENIVKLDNGRQELFKDLVDSFGDEEPLVVFCRFRMDIKEIRKILKNSQRTIYEVSGRKNDYLQFRENPNGSIIICQIASGAEALNLTAARYCIYYTIDYKLMQFNQSKKRVMRAGQKRKVTYYFLQSNTYAEKAIYKCLKNNQEIINIILEKKNS